MAADPAVIELLDAHNRREREHPETGYARWVGVNSCIDVRDEIFHFVHGHPTAGDPLRDYLLDGYRTLAELMVALEHAGHPLLRSQRFLEFACGYGRFTRHLVRVLPPVCIDAADIMPGTDLFVSMQFGVTGLQSTADPAQLSLPRTYDTVFVLSLFTHLPASSWKAWLRRLYDALDPGGVLLFTTHGDGFAQRHGVSLAADGFFFNAESESSELPGELYGTTITSADYVRRAVAALPEATLRWHKPDHFWAGQDAWVVARDNRSAPWWRRALAKS